ncbi:hypothetical protein SAMN05216251_14315 [Actinacidiphila alni]|uniref:Uncharacterized protein n=1 Tax=Actinacidiphila alni TaxID=380248 RepID=A0A1I2MZD4_9ACTN|nr:hypothetical protein [Actinacidiphila alni]SFF94817.1 hypothetical protein SAMN05216251_14315 [Actinacidiphila alni]
MDKSIAAEWDRAHTDFTRPPNRPAPAGLTASETDWRTRLETTTPGGWLLADNAMTTTMTSGKPIHLMHTTNALDAIRASGQLYASSGCLVAAVYCAPLTPVAGGLRPHNLGAYLRQTKPHTQTLILQITPAAPAAARGIDYLRLGPVHLRTYQQHRSFLTAQEDDQLRTAAVSRIRATASFLDMLLANATGRLTDPAAFVDRLAAAVPGFPFLGYLYFEVLSEYLMLHSTSTETAACAEHGEMNNLLYKRLAFTAVPGMAKLFDLALFHPDSQTLRGLIAGIEPGLADGAATYTRDRLSHLFAAVALHPGQDATSVTFAQPATFEDVAAYAPGLLGQTLFREMRILPRYPQLYPVFEQAKALEAWSYWNTHRIATPFNGVLPKGEIGVSTAHPGSNLRAWAATTDDRGLLHLAEPIDIAPSPRLADLHLTAMRRDKTGQAAGHCTTGTPRHTEATGDSRLTSRDRHP